MSHRSGVAFSLLAILWAISCHERGVKLREAGECKKGPAVWGRFTTKLQEACAQTLSRMDFAHTLTKVTRGAKTKVLYLILMFLFFNLRPQNPR